ncbi:MAG: urease accessory protein UreE [Pseudomonadota bacterium]
MSCITLSATERHLRRKRLVADDGAVVMLDLPSARMLVDGEQLEAVDGSIVTVHAAVEPLLEVRGRDARHLNALAWQIGNRHLTAQIEAERILIERDRVIADMLSGLGAQLAEVQEPFHPEGGAYGDHSHSHSHSHSRSHSHRHSHTHGHHHG